MLSKHSTAYLLLLTLFFTLACSTTDIFPTPQPTHTPTPKPKKPETHEVFVPENCFREGKQTYLAPDRNYCFAYPPGYYVTIESEGKNIELRYFNSMSSEEFQENILSIEDIEENANTVTLETSIRIEYTEKQDENKLSLFDFAEKHKKDQGYTKDIKETSIGDEAALIIRETVYETQGEGENTIKSAKSVHIIYVKHEKKYYTITLSCKALKEYDIVTKNEAEDLFFILQNTFTFID